MLGPVILDKHAPDWIICGGESGRSPREMDPQWARDLRDGARRFDRKFFMKQMTGKKPIPADLLVRQFPQLRPFKPTSEQAHETSFTRWNRNAEDQTSI